MLAAVVAVATWPPVAPLSAQTAEAEADADPPAATEPAEPTPPAEPPPPPPPPEPEPEPEPEPAAPTVERTVYIPFENLEAVFEQQGRGVFLPYEEYENLWQAFLRDRAVQAAAPEGGLLRRADYRATLTEGGLEIEARIEAEALREGWSRVRLGGTGLPPIIDSDTGDALLHRSADGLDLLLPRRGVHEVTLRMLVPVIEEGGRSRVRLQLPEAAVGRLEADLPGAELEFDLQPGLPYTSAAADQAADEDEPAPRTALSLFFGGVSDLTLGWREPSEAEALEPLYFVDTSVQTVVRPGVVTSEVDLNLRILRAGLERVEIELPAGQLVLDVQADHLLDWEIEDGDGEDEPPLLVVRTLREVELDWTVRLTLESALAGLPAEFDAPLPQVRGAVRQRGTVALFNESELELAVDPGPGLTRQADRDERDQLESAGHYRFLEVPVQLSAAVSQAEPVVDMNSVIHLSVTPQRAELQASLTYAVRRVGIFNARVGLPEGWQGIEAAGPAVEDFAILGEGADRVLEIRFVEPLLGSSQVTVSGWRNRAEPAEALPLPVLVSEGTRRHDGRLEVRIDSSLEPNTEQTGDLRPADRAAGTRSAADDGVTVAFTYRDPSEGGLMRFTERQPQVSSDLLARVTLEEQRVVYRWLLKLDVRYAGIDRFTLAVPDSIADELRLVHPAIREIRRPQAATDNDAADADPDAAPDAAPDADADPDADPDADAADADADADAAVEADADDGEDLSIDGMQLWEIVLRERTLGELVLEPTLERPLPGLEAGRAETIEVPFLRTPGVFQELGQVALAKSGNIEILSADLSGLEETDPRQLRQGGSAGVFIAWQYRQPPVDLTLQVSRNAFLAVPGAVIPHADLSVVVSTDGAMTCELVLWLQNRSQQFLTLRLPDGARLVSDIQVGDGRQQPMQRADDDAVLVRLEGSGIGDGDQAVPVRLVYEIASDDPGRNMPGGGRWQIPVPAVDQVRILQSRLRLYLPQEAVFTRFQGPMRLPVEQSGWARFRRATDYLIPALGPDIEGRRPSPWSGPPALDSQGGSGFDLELSREGQQYELHRLAEPAEVTVRFRSRTRHQVYEGFWFLLALAGGLLVPTGRRVLYAVAGGAGLLLLAGLIQGQNASIPLAGFVGVALAVPVWLATGSLQVVNQWRRRRTERRPQDRGPDDPGSGGPGDGPPPPAMPGPAGGSAAPAAADQPLPRPMAKPKPAPDVQAQAAATAKKEPPAATTEPPKPPHPDGPHSDEQPPADNPKQPS